MIKDIEQVTHRVISLRTPTAQSSLMMLNGMNHSLASLRAWIILGEDQFKLERQNAWNQQIDPSFKKMLELSRNWTEQHNVQLLQEINTEIEKFRKYQQEIETIAHTEGNTPANQILFKKVAPLERSVLNHITKLIKLELNQRGSPERKGLVALLSDLETSVGVTLEKIEEYLLSGTKTFKVQFEQHWSRNNQLFTELQKRAHLFTEEQKQILQIVSEIRDEMGPLLQEMITIRSSDQWNRAHFKLKNQAGPVAASITHRLNEMMTSQNVLLQNDFDEVTRRTHFLIVILVGWFIVGGLISGVLGSTITRGISVPLQNLDHLVSQLSKGNFIHDPIPTLTSDELGVLIKNANDLVVQLRAFRRHATNLLSGNLKTQEFDLEGDYKRILEDILKVMKGQAPPPSP